MKKIVFIVSILAILVASVILSIAIEHNTMQVFCRDLDTNLCSFDYSYATFIWLSWFIPTFVILFVVFIIFRKLIQLVLKF